jgi:TM2 domain-containing membrane protein YozV
MYCRFCGKEMAEDQKVCVYCGRDNQGSYATKKIYSHELTRLKPQKEEKNAGIAAALGFFFGWIFLGPVGYIYLGQWNWFWLTFVLQILIYPLTLGIAIPVLPVVFAIHQYQMAKELNEIREAENGDSGAEAEVQQTTTGTAETEPPER